MLIRTRPPKGFTLLEVMIALAILGLLLAFAIPEFSTMVMNRKVRSKAEGIQAGLQTARNEALRRNAAVTFALVAAPPAVGAFALAPVPGGPDWVVAQVPGGGNALTVIDGQGSQEGGDGPVIAAAGAVPVPAVVFNSLGGTNLGATASFAVTHSVHNCVAQGGPIRCLNVSVGVNGRIVMCDPSITVATDSRFCPT